MLADIREAADLSERTKEDHGTVYIQGNILQIEWDRPDTSEYPKLETWTYETDADAQAKFDEWTQGWYQKGVRDPRGQRNPSMHSGYFQVGHKNSGILWLYHDGEIKTAPGSGDHNELAGELGILPKWPAKFDAFFNKLHRGRYEPRTGKVSYVSLDGHDMPSWLQTKLEEKFGDIEVETFANNGADGSFNAWISPKGKLLNLLDGRIKDAWLTHWEYANQVLGYADIHGAFKNGYVRVSIAPQGHSIVQARDLKKSLPVIQKALKDTYEKVGSIPIWVEDEFGEWDAETDLGKLVSATNLEELKELASNPESPSTDKILQTLEQEGYSLTDDVRLACWMTPDGEMINCSGDGRTRGIDHREISNVADVGYGNTAGMHRLMQLGFIRLKPEAPGFDLTTAPTRAQRRALAKWLSEFRGDEIFVEAYDSRTATFDARNEYFSYARHESFEFERGENPGRILSEVEDFYTVDMASNPASSNPPITERLLAMGVHPDVVAYVDTLNEHPKIQGMLFKEFKEGKFEKLGDVMKFVESKLPKKPTWSGKEQLYLSIALETAPFEEVQEWFKYQLPKLRTREYARPALGGGFEKDWEHDLKLTADNTAWNERLQLDLEDPRMGQASRLSQIFSGIYDWLNGEMQDSDTFPNIKTMSWEAVLNAVNTWHQQCLISEEGSGEVYDDTDEEVYVFPDGYRIVKVMSANNLEVEGNKMRHCVGSYANQVQEGSVQIYSLRDAENEPHVTVEIDSNDWVNQIKGVANSEPKPEYKAKLREWFTAKKEFKTSPDFVWEEMPYRPTLDEMETILDSTTFAHSRGNEYGLTTAWDWSSLERVYENVYQAALRQWRSSRGGNWRQHDITDTLAILWSEMPVEDQKKFELFLQKKESEGVDAFDKNWYFEGDDENAEQEARDEAMSTFMDYAIPSDIITKYYELKGKN